ncbi:MAG: helix-turn-helix transcriptional regulator [Clostridia bacterium]
MKELNVLSIELIKKLKEYISEEEYKSINDKMIRLIIKYQEQFSPEDVFLTAPDKFYYDLEDIFINTDIDITLFESIYEECEQELLNYIKTAHSSDNQNYKVILAKRLKDLLYANNMSQTELSKRAKVTESTISNFINSKQLPKLEIICRIADVFNATTDYLLGRDITEVKVEISPDKTLESTCLRLIEELSEEDKKTVEEFIQFLKLKKKFTNK